MRHQIDACTPSCSSLPLDFSNARHHDRWPAIDTLGLSQAEVQARVNAIGGSDANVILSGDPDRLSRLWREKRGQQAPEDLSNMLPVVLGCWTEPFNRQWYEKTTGNRVLGVGDTITCSSHQWRRCTLDGIVEATGAVFEAKHCSAFAKADELLARYMPQLQHNMAVTRSQRAVLSILFGNSKYEIIEVASDWLYQLELFRAEAAFWECVVTGREPVPAVPPAAPKPLGTREVCLEKNNAWASAATDWLENKVAAKRHAAACTSIKDLVEDDVARAFGHGIEAKRSRSGAITIREVAR